MFDPLGRVVASLPLGVEGILDAPLPRPLAVTLYARLGDAPAGLIVLGGLGWVMLSRRRRPMG